MGKITVEIKKNTFGKIDHPNVEAPLIRISAS